MILTPLQKLPKNVGDLGKLIVAKGFKKLLKVQKIAKSGHTGCGRGNGVGMWRDFSCLESRPEIRLHREWLLNCEQIYIVEWQSFLQIYEINYQT